MLLWARISPPPSFSNLKILICWQGRGLFFPKLLKNYLTITLRRLLCKHIITAPPDNNFTFWVLTPSENIVSKEQKLPVMIIFLCVTVIFTYLLMKHALAKEIWTGIHKTNRKNVLCLVLQIFLY